MAASTYPTHLTLSPEERAQLGLPEPGATASPRNRLLKRHEFRVFYPDGMEGTCQYERFGPRYHSFHFRYGTANNASGTPLPRQYLDQTLGNTPAAIEAAGLETAQAAFASAIRRERDEYFKRAMSPTGRKPDPTAFQFSVKRAKEIGGKYAMCVLLGTKLIPASSCLYPTLDEANAAWQQKPEQEQATFIVACACRWSRRWEKPKYNPLNQASAAADNA